MRTQSCRRILICPSIRFAIILTAIAACTTAFISRTSSGIQTVPQQSSGISLGPLFEQDLADLKPTQALKSLIEKARSNRPECPDALTLKVVIKGVGDPIFRDTLAKARVEALETFFENNGFKKGRDYKLEAPDLKGQNDDVYASYSSPSKPKLNTTSKPEKGTKVKVGDTITVTLTAADDANSVQSGIRAIQLIDLNTKGLVPNPWYAESSGVARCSSGARRPPPLTVVYKVPAGAPPLVRLEASAEDFAGNIDRDLGEFPLGDWYGTMKLRRELVNEGYQHTITWTFAVSEVAGGQPNYTEVRGRALGQIVTMGTHHYEECTFQHNINPTRFELEVTGQRLGDRLIINFPDPGVIDTVRQTCSRGYDATEPQPFTDTQAVSFDISGITPRAQYPLRSEVPPSDSNNRVTTTMELYRAKK